jgi:hypothetical protein
MSNSKLTAQVSGQPPEMEAEVLAINAQARSRSLQFASLSAHRRWPRLANSFRMMRLPDIKPSASAEQAGLC